MLSLPTRWGLFFASWLPTWVVWGVFALVNGSRWSLIFALIAGVGIMALVSFFQDIVPGKPQMTGRLLTCRRQDHTLLSYAAWYLLPFFIAPMSDWTQAIVVIGIVGFVGILYMQGNCITSNPTLLLLGFRFYDIQMEGLAESHMLLTRRRICVGKDLQVVRIGDLLIGI